MIRKYWVSATISFVALLIFYAMFQDRTLDDFCLVPLMVAILWLSFRFGVSGKAFGPMVSMTISALMTTAGVFAIVAGVVNFIVRRSDGIVGLAAIGASIVMSFFIASRFMNWLREKPRNDAVIRMLVVSTGFTTAGTLLSVITSFAIGDGTVLGHGLIALIASAVAGFACIWSVLAWLIFFEVDFRSARNV